MKRILVVMLALAALSTAASAQVLNGQFDYGLAVWSSTGAAGIHPAGDFGVQPSPSGGDWAGAISSWGGDWNAPLGTISQTVNFAGDGVLTGELFAGAHSADAWRNCGVEVLWNGSVVASLARDADAVKWAQDFPWESFSAPVTGVGANELKVNFIVHFGEWTWVGVDNLNVAAVPEPGSIVALLGGLAGFGGLAIRRRK